MRLETDRLLLREFTAQDWPDVLAYQSDPLYLRYYPWTFRTADQVQAFVNMFLVWQQERPRTRFQLAIVLKAENKLIGNCGIRGNNGALIQADMGYELDSLYWGRGYATEAARAMVAFGFDTLHLERVWAECVAENVASVRVLEKVGLRLEKREPAHQFIKGRWHDRLVYAIDAEEWREQQG